jgi:hypothetical protein
VEPGWKPDDDSGEEYQSMNTHIRYSAMMVVRAMRDCAGRDTLYGEHVRDYKVLGMKWRADWWLRHSKHCGWCLEALDWHCSGAELAEMCKNGQLNWGRIGYWLSRLLERA